jgi:hypothetical protein
MRHAVLSAVLALGLLSGCSRNAQPAEPGEGAPGGATPSARLETPTPSEVPVHDTEPGPPQAPEQAGPTVFFVKASGVRCIAAPCPTFTAARPDKPGEDEMLVHELDLSALNVGEEKREELRQATERAPGLKVEAIVDVQRDAGPAGDATVLRVMRVLEQHQ